MTEATQASGEPVERAPARPPRGTIVFWIGWSLCWLSFLFPFPRRVRGAHHVPKKGPVLIVANHVSFLDIPAVGTAVHRHVSFVARETLTENRFLAWFLPKCDAILIRRGEADRGALREIVTRLEAGGAVAIFPEGTRSKDGRVHPFKGGALYAAYRTGAPVVPVGVRRTERALDRRNRPRVVRVEVVFGPPVHLDPSRDRAEAELELRRTVAELAGRELA
jgi:1-acyl-sn-glycerol-3-phosphate acyltransferase